ncbi:MAG: alpha/beta fold hydrolase [Chloroflexi bacterium]|nr:alpha/beta fold hydrolase [Chloroflexota bacterium]
MPPDAIAAAERTIQIEGHTVHYWEAGEGEPVIFLHGLGNSAFNWRKNVSVVGERHRAITMDLPGHGRSDLVWFPYRLEDASRFVVAFMDALQLERVHLVGNSLGGAIALETALAQPGRVRTLTLVGSVGLGKEIAGFLRLGSLPLLGEYGHRPNESSVRKLLRTLVHNPSAIEEAAVHEMLAFRRRPGAVGGILRMLRAGVTIQGQKKSVRRDIRIAELKMPLFVAWGRQDPVAPVAHGERAAKLAQAARLKIFEECGHWPHLEQAEAFNGALLDFLSTAR